MSNEPRHEGRRDDRGPRQGGGRRFVRARLIAVASMRWCGAQVPEIRRGRILPRSGMNDPSSRESL